MYQRFWIICLVIGAGLLVLSVLGLSSLRLHERGLRAERQNQFTAVAEQVRSDVKRTLDEFLQTEQRRPYTDYQYAYVPDTTNQTEALVRSPLADSLTHGLAFGHFQIDAAGHITTPYVRADMPKESRDPELAAYLDTLERTVLASLNRHKSRQVRYVGMAAPGGTEALRSAAESGMPGMPESPEPMRLEPAASRQLLPQAAVPRATPRGGDSRARTYPIESLQEAQMPQTVLGRRGMVASNIAMATDESEHPAEAGGVQRDDGETKVLADLAKGAAFVDERMPAEALAASSEPTVQIRIEPFVPLVVPEEADSQSVFSGQIFLVRHVQIEGVHLLQGFRLNEGELAEQVQESARRLLREGMAAELNRNEHPGAAHAAILDFGFGEMVLNLFERDPGWITARISRLNLWMATILTVVWLSVVLAMAALWRNLHEQVKLARQKDDFISAVSHELRTPLTSIRMYTEMLEKGWVKDEAKRGEYYGTMRQESERLSRLIENVLDFSRLQRGKKQFEFSIGDINGCIGDVVEMMRPCAERSGFVLETEFLPIGPFAFDRDAVMQIVINLIDNALKYAKEAVDRRIVVRTRPEHGAAVIEVEDHGPGVPKSHQKRIFEAFYRCGDEATGQTVGTGLGLALVKRFADAHRGGVEILSITPAGALFRVRLAR